MPSIFDRISKTLRGHSDNKQAPNAPATSNANSLASASEMIEESSPPPDQVEDAMSIPSFRKIAEENEKKLRELTKVHIEYLTNYLKEINNDEERTNKADILLKELQGVLDRYKENGDRAVVHRIMKALEPFASQKINDAITYSRPYSIYPKKATELPKLYENFLEAFRWNEEEKPGEEKKQSSTSQFKP